MATSGLMTNLAAAQTSMNFVAQDFNSTALQDVQAGITGAMSALTSFQGLVANGQEVDATLPNAMVANVTEAINELDNVNGVYVFLPTSMSSVSRLTCMRVPVRQRSMLPQSPTPCSSSSPPPNTR